MFLSGEFEVEVPVGYTLLLHYQHNLISVGSDRHKFMGGRLVEDDWSLGFEGYLEIPSIGRVGSLQHNLLSLV